jgi:hypothetical protein
VWAICRLSVLVLGGTLLILRSPRFILARGLAGIRQRCLVSNLGLRGDIDNYTDSLIDRIRTQLNYDPILYYKLSL